MTISTDQHYRRLRLQSTANNMSDSLFEEMCGFTAERDMLAGVILYLFSDKPELKN